MEICSTQQDKTHSMNKIEDDQACKEERKRYPLR